MGEKPVTVQFFPDMLNLFFPQGSRLEDHLPYSQYPGVTFSPFAFLLEAQFTPDQRAFLHRTIHKLQFPNIPHYSPGSYAGSLVVLRTLVGTADGSAESEWSLKGIAEAIANLTATMEGTRRGAFLLERCSNAYFERAFPQTRKTLAGSTNQALDQLALNGVGAEDATSFCAKNVRVFSIATLGIQPCLTAAIDFILEG